MSKRCNHIRENGFRCGSYAFNLWSEGVEQGNLCDVHYWQDQAQVTQKARAAERAMIAEQPAQQKPVAWLFQHEETGRTTCVNAQHVEEGFAEDNPRWQKVAPLYTTPQQGQCIIASYGK